MIIIAMLNNILYIDKQAMLINRYSSYIILLIILYLLLFNDLICKENQGINVDSAKIIIEQQKTETNFDKVWKGIKSSFHNLNPKDSSKQTMLEDFSGNIGIQIPLKKSEPYIYERFQTQGEPSNNLNLNATIRWNPISYYYLYLTFYKYVQPELQAPWHPDFAYSFGYEDWNPYTFSLTYSNYQGNRLLPKSERDEVFTRFLEGTFSFGWKFPTPVIIENILCHHYSSNVMHQLCLNTTPQYYDLKTNSKLNWKNSISLETKYYIYSYYFIRLNCFYYPNSEKQQQWDPDFTYGFGYFDWHYGTFSIQYNNYSGNRYFWSKKKTDSGKFVDGFFSVTWNWGF